MKQQQTNLQATVGALAVLLVTRTLRGVGGAQAATSGSRLNLSPECYAPPGHVACRMPGIPEVLDWILDNRVY